MRSASTQRKYLYDEKLMNWLDRRFGAFCVTAAAVSVALTGCVAGPSTPGRAIETVSPPQASAPFPTSAQPRSDHAGPVPGSECPVVTGPANRQLVDVRVGRHATFDQMTFDFADGTDPSGPATDRGTYVLRSTDTVTTDGRGDPVEMAGTRLYVLQLRGAGGYDVERGHPTYQGPAEFAPGFPALVDARMVGDFESVISWGIGVNTPECPAVTELSAPPRLVLTFPYPP